MLSKQSFNGLQTAMNRVAKVQEHLTTGRLINRPSDDPTGASSAMRIRSNVALREQYQRNATDAMGWLSQADSTLSSMGDQVRRAYEISLQGANSGSMGPDALRALATEVDQIREGMIDAANTQYLDRPVFGGVTNTGIAYNAAGKVNDPTAVTPTGVLRTVGDGAQVRVDVDARATFGDDSANDSVFDHLADLSAALKAGDQVAIEASIAKLDGDGKRITTMQATVGARTNSVENAQAIAADGELTLRTALSEIENVDLAKATVDLNLQQVAYQAALGATARVIQPSLLDFLR
jgi:flagellar hook-associated protein 3 FlgL